MKIETVSIVGLGALGIMYGQHLTNAVGKERVRIVVNKERKERYQKTGIFSNGEKLDFQYVDEAVSMEPADLVIVAVKGTSLDSAVETAKNQVGPNTVILSVVNGITSEEILGSVFGHEKVVHCVAQGMDSTRTGNELSYQNMGELCLGIDSAEKQERLDAVVAFFDKVGLPFIAETNIKHRMWAKYMLNVGVNQVVMVTESDYGEIQKEGPSRDMMIAAMKEVLPLAQAEGVHLTERDLEEYLTIIGKVSPTGMPSMRQDGLAKRYSEVDMFSGTVVEKSRSLNFEVPTNEYLLRKIKEIESTY